MAPILFHGLNQLMSNRRSRTSANALGSQDLLARATARQRSRSPGASHGQDEGTPSSRCGVIYADPPWRFEPYSVEAN